MNSFDSSRGGSSPFEMKREKGLGANNFFPDQSSVGESGTIPEMKSEKQFAAPSLYPRKFLLDLATDGTAAGISRLFSLPFERMIANGWRPSLLLQPGQKLKSFVEAVKKAAPYSRPALLNHARYASMFTFNLALKDAYRHTLSKGLDRNGSLLKTMAVNFVAGGAAGLTTLCFVYPFDYARAHIGITVDKAGYLDKGFGDRMMKIFNSQGPMGLYRGFSVTAAHVSFFYAFFFGIFDTMKGDSGLFNTFACACVSSIAADLITMPFFKIREARMKQSNFKNVYFVGSLSGSFRNTGAVMLLIYHMMQSNSH